MSTLPAQPRGGAVLFALAMVLLATPGVSRAADDKTGGKPNAEAPYWVDPMHKVHAKFTGTHGTFAHFGDSITVSMAFWSGLPYDHKNLDPAAQKAFDLVKGYIKDECWRWKGPQYGNEGGMQINWAEQNVDQWLKKLNPEVALIMFGTNDLGAGRGVDDYVKRTRGVVQKCLDNGTVVILSTAPPRTHKLEEAKAYADAIRKLGKEMGVPVEDYFEAVVSRRPDDWDGAAEKFKAAENAKDTYDVPTPISRDGVHPSAPKQYAGDYSEEALKHHGYNLRSYVTLLAYADVIRDVLK